MFDIGWSELLVIAVVAIVVVGPKDLPKLMRTFGHYAGKLRRAAGDFQRQFEDAMRESEVDEVRKNIESIRGLAQPPDLKAPADKPLMLPKQEAPPPTVAPSPAVAQASIEPKPAKQRAPAKPKTAAKAADKPAAPKRRKAKAEPKP